MSYQTDRIRQKIRKKCGSGFFPAKVVDQLAPVIADTRLNPNYPTRAMIHLLIASGEYDKYLQYLAKLYRPRMDALNNALARHLDGIDVPRVTGRLLLLPGMEKTLLEKCKGPLFRLTFPSVKPEDIEREIEGIGAASRELRSKAL